MQKQRTQRSKTVKIEKTNKKISNIIGYANFFNKIFLYSSLFLQISIDFFNAVSNVNSILKNE